MKRRKLPLKRGLWLFFLFSSFALRAQDSSFIRVHFLYGSKPAKEGGQMEEAWFGGKWGGHVGIELDSDRVIDFLPGGGFHVFAKDGQRNSHFVERSLESFWETFGSRAEGVKKLSIIIKVSAAQKQQLDSLARAYLEKTPYDYAFFGMRCAAAAYDLLGKAGIMKKRTRPGIITRYFYVKPLRKKMIRTARKRGWELKREKGLETRDWEQDPPKKR